MYIFSYTLSRWLLNAFGECTAIVFSDLENFCGIV